MVKIFIPSLGNRDGFFLSKDNWDILPQYYLQTIFANPDQLFWWKRRNGKVRNSKEGCLQRMWHWAIISPRNKKGGQWEALAMAVKEEGAQVPRAVLIEQSHTENTRFACLGFAYWDGSGSIALQGQREIEKKKNASNFELVQFFWVKKVTKGLPLLWARYILIKTFHLSILRTHFYLKVQ